MIVPRIKRKDGSKPSVFVRVVIDDEREAWLKELADRESRSISNMVSVLLAEALDARRDR